MTTEEACAHIGDGVIYRPRPHRPWADEPEEGIITSVNDSYVFVRYGGQQTSAATNPADLELLAAPAATGTEPSGA